MFIDDIRRLKYPEQTSAAWRLAMTLLQLSHLEMLMAAERDRRPVAHIHGKDPKNGVDKLVRETVPRSLQEPDHFQKRHAFSHTFLQALWEDAQDYMSDDYAIHEELMAPLKRVYGVKLNRQVSHVFWPDRDPDPEDGFTHRQKGRFWR